MCIVKNGFSIKNIFRLRKQFYNQNFMYFLVKIGDFTCFFDFRDKTSRCISPNKRQGEAGQMSGTAIFDLQTSFQDQFFLGSALKHVFA